MKVNFVLKAFIRSAKFAEDIIKIFGNICGLKLQFIISPKIFKNTSMVVATSNFRMLTMFNCNTFSLSLQPR